MNLLAVADATHANIGQLPAGMKAAGYTTGTADIAWTPADWNAHPNAVRICQDVNASDTTADVLDRENGAAPLDKVVEWQQAAWKNRSQGVRVGQRWPCIYASQSNITPIANALTAAKITSGVFFWIANWNLTQAQADVDVLTGSGPWPVVGVQYQSTPHYDLSIFSGAWWGNVTPKPAPPSPITKVQAMAALVTLTGYVQET